MPNIKRNESDKRRNYMKALIHASPETSGDRLNELFAKKFGDRMRINTIYDLKAELGYGRTGDKRPAAAAAPKKAGEQGPTARRAPQEILNVFPMLIQLDSEDPTTLVERVFARLSQAGVVSLRVLKGDGWVVIETNPEAT